MTKSDYRRQSYEKMETMEKNLDDLKMQNAQISAKLASLMEGLKTTQTEYCSLEKLEKTLSFYTETSKF